MDETWIKYDGKGQPVPDGTPVDVFTLRESQIGHVSEIMKAEFWDWCIENDDGDIIGYKVINND